MEVMGTQSSFASGSALILFLGLSCLVRSESGKDMRPPCIVHSEALLNNSY